ncbi:MAG TPA: leucine-rich repeat domain-containing protein, partial [Fusibacter sp.]|nr:leucine-rich repeat domain-containing protein [Fusibacter sp.]
PFETPALDRISFIDTNISDFDFLKGATAATDVSFTSCGITSIAFMKDWMALESINLDDNNINDLSPLEGKTQIIYLSLHKNDVESIEALSSLTALEALNISYNKISNIEPIMQLEALTEFTAYEELDKRIIDRGLLESLEGKGVLVEYHK